MPTPTAVTTRVCAEPSCPNLVAGASRCHTHKLPERGRPHRRNSQHVLTATHCSVCGEAFTPDNKPTRGHIVAIADGGSNAPGNYQAECAACNYGKRGS